MLQPGFFRKRAGRIQDKVNSAVKFLFCLFKEALVIKIFAMLKA